MQFINMLSAWQWGVLGALPVAIVALYFLKLKREPLEVPSTFLWTRSIEDLRVNSLWQRLRRSLLLVLQLLLLAILAVAFLRPHWNGGHLAKDRYIFLIDNSASMNATDVAPTRLDEAKRRVGQLIDAMEAGSKAMIISFSDKAQVEQRLHRQFAGPAPRSGGNSPHQSVHGARRSAAAGCRIGPSRQRRVPPEPTGPSRWPRSSTFFSDGRFPDVHGFSMENLTPQFVPIGDARHGQRRDRRLRHRPERIPSRSFAGLRPA